MEQEITYHPTHPKEEINSKSMELEHALVRIEKKKIINSFVFYSAVFYPS